MTWNKPFLSKKDRALTIKLNGNEIRSWQVSLKQAESTWLFQKWKRMFLLVSSEIQLLNERTRSFLLFLSDSWNIPSSSSFSPVFFPLFPSFYLSLGPSTLEELVLQRLSLGPEEVQPLSDTPLWSWRPSPWGWASEKCPCCGLHSTQNREKSNWTAMLSRQQLFPKSPTRWGGERPRRDLRA